MKLSIVMPAYNERRTIREILGQVLAVDLGDLEREIVIGLSGHHVVELHDDVGAKRALDRDDAPRAFRQQRARQTARAGANFDHGRALQGAAGAGDARGQIEIEQEVLAERFLGGQAMPVDHVAQRRQVVDLAHIDWRMI